MLARFVTDASNGRPVFITELRRSLLETASLRLECVLVLADGEHVKRFSIPIPVLAELSTAEYELVRSFVRAEIYNHLATLGGYSLSVYLPDEANDARALVEQVVEDFQLDSSRDARGSYARIVNMLDRMNDALHPASDPDERRFSIDIRPLGELPPGDESVRFTSIPTDTFAAVTRGLEGTLICGLDIGGTDIKGAVAVDGKLIALKEYDWNPASYAEVELIVEPIVTLARLLRARAALEQDGDRGADDRSVAGAVADALSPSATHEQMLAAVELAEQALGAGLRPYDAVGLCFPDVVVKDRIVGGEVPKTRAMRGNVTRDFEEQFARLTDLNLRLQKLCREGGVVRNTNDGPMAAFTAAVEIAASPTPEVGREGVFAHTLGTDLGSGLALADGSIPEIPLELYNLILDLGDTPARMLAADDLRSLANTNTGIAGTPQKLASQAAAFRLADPIVQGDPELRDAVERSGFVAVTGAESAECRRVVPETPNDLRKPYLAWLMERSASHAGLGEVFRTIGEYMAVVYEESEHLLGTGLTQRFLFGRFVKQAHVFELMQAGAERRSPELRFVAADSEMAYTPLMRELDTHPDYSVAQFGQAIGAIYFGNLGLIER
ncbi:MAG: hypothetical protein ACOC0O_04660 [Spirochaetota bacterium]